MLGFYIGIGTVLAFIVTGAFMWKPLRLRYAIYRLEQVTEEDVNTPGFDWDAYAGWSSTCLRAAHDGDRRALKAFMPLLLWRIPALQGGSAAISSVLTHGTGFGFVMSCPDLFFSVLDEMPDDDAKKIISDIEHVCWIMRDLLDEAEMPKRHMAAVADRLRDHCRSKDGTVNCVAKHTLEYVRRRFPEDAAKEKAGNEVKR